MHPPGHALGALLLEQDRVAEAEQVYRADLKLDNCLSRPLQHSNNVWSLHGYVECLERSGNHAEANELRQQLDLAVRRAGQDDHILMLWSYEVLTDVGDSRKVFTGPDR